ncbi:MAG: nucleotide exchange factor GrpE [Chloroflexia bacterium]|nr:nucleotide exchange factor GrpE [Chloroflexia bacterium]
MRDIKQTTATSASPDREGEVLAEDREPSLDLDMDAIVAERDAYLDQVQRGRAEFANFRRRTEQERSLIRELVSRELLAQILPIEDDLQRALRAVPAEQRETSWVQGVELIERKLSGILDRAGVTQFESLGQLFDPAVHEAVATEPGTSGGTVVEIFQPGYRLGQSLLRPAMVKVGDAPAENGTGENHAVQ